MSTHLVRQWAIVATLLAGSSTAAIAAPSDAPLIRSLVTDRVRASLVHDLPGALRDSVDVGRLPAYTPVPDVLVTLNRSPKQQAALDQLGNAQLDRTSPLYHHWLKPAQLATFSPSQADIQTVSRWLVSHGLTVKSVSHSGMTIRVSGDVGHFETAFNTQIHQVLRDGEAHVSNVTAPSIPAALSPLVAGVTLSDFFPKPQFVRPNPALTVNSSFKLVAPGDFATIYNTNPLLHGPNYFNRHITGAGVTIAVLEVTEIQPADWQTFRTSFGLQSYAGTLTFAQPGGCKSPGIRGADGVDEAALDAEWASAVAPDANTILAACVGSAPFGFGVYDAFEGLVENPTPATILSVSFGGPEQASGYGFIQAWTHLAQEGTMEGKTIMVSSGDSGSSAVQKIDPFGTAISGLSDSRFVTAVGGTDFQDALLNETNQYWSPTNSATGESALSYIPEIPWDDSCASSINAAARQLTPQQVCNMVPNFRFRYGNGVGGTGGQSLYYAKPDFQALAIPGMPNDGVRDNPDVSLFAADGFNGQAIVYCQSDSQHGGHPCVYNTTAALQNAAGGTSFASPMFAGIVALTAQEEMIQAHSSTPGLGNINIPMYAIARTQFRSPLGLSQCNASLGNQTSTICAFHDVTAGDNAEPCYAGTPNCVTTADSTRGIGILGATLNGQAVDAFPAGPGYSLATGLGSVNATNFLYSFTDY